MIHRASSASPPQPPGSQTTAARQPACQTPLAGLGSNAPRRVLIAMVTPAAEAMRAEYLRSSGTQTFPIGHCRT
jgi:hypothetical protein